MKSGEQWGTAVETTPRNDIKSITTKLTDNGYFYRAIQHAIDKENHKNRLHKNKTKRTELSNSQILFIDNQLDMQVKHALLRNNVDARFFQLKPQTFLKLTKTKAQTRKCELCHRPAFKMDGPFCSI